MPGTSSSMMLRQFTIINPYLPPSQPPTNPYGFDPLGTSFGAVPNAARWAIMQSPFGHLANMVATAAAASSANVIRDAAGVPAPDVQGHVQAFGAAHYYRILDYVHVPSRYVGTDTMLNAESFNDVPGVVDDPIGTNGAYGSDIPNPVDPRYYFQPPFNRVSREREPGQVNLNTVTGRRMPPWEFDSLPRHWSPVFDGIMNRHEQLGPVTEPDLTRRRRYGDSNLIDSGDNPIRLGHLGPAWRTSC